MNWQVFLITLVGFLLAVGGMAIGVILSNRRLKGSCGGMSSMPGSDGKSICDLCTNPSPECSRNPSLEGCDEDECDDHAEPKAKQEAGA